MFAEHEVCPALEPGSATITILVINLPIVEGSLV